MNAKLCRIYFSTILNAWKHIYQLSPEVEFNLRDHVPDVLIQDYIEALEKQFFCGFFVNNNNHTVDIKFFKDIILDPDYEEWSDGVISIEEINLEKPDAISKLSQTFDSADANSSMLKSIDDYIKTLPVNGYSTLLPAASFGDNDNNMTLCTLENKYWLCKPNEDDYIGTSKWEQFCFDYFTEMKLREDGKEYVAKCSGIPSSRLYYGKPYTEKCNDNWVTEYQREWLVPDVSQPMKINAAPETYKNQSSLRFLFYRGMQKGRTWEGADQFKVVNFYDLKIFRQDDGHLLFSTNGSEILFSNSPISPSVPFSNTWIALWTGNGSTDMCIYLKTVTSQVRVPNLIENDDGSFQNAATFPIDTERLYPMASQDVYDTLGNKIPDANYSLKWQGEYGIVNKFGQPVIDFLNKAKPVKILKRMTPEQLKNIDFSKKKRINGNHYLITQVNGELLEKEISICELIAYKD